MVTDKKYHFPSNTLTTTQNFIATTWQHAKSIANPQYLNITSLATLSPHVILTLKPFSMPKQHNSNTLSTTLSHWFKTNICKFVVLQMLAQNGQSLHLEFHWTGHLHYHGTFTSWQPWMHVSSVKKIENNISLQLSLKSDWRNPPVRKHRAVFVSSVLFNRLQPIDFSLDRLSLDRPSRCLLRRGSEALLLMFFYDRDRFDTMRLFGARRHLQTVLHVTRCGVAATPGGRERNEKRAAKNTKQKRLFSWLNLLRNHPITGSAEFVCGEIPVTDWHSCGSSVAVIC